MAGPCGRMPEKHHQIAFFKIRHIPVFHHPTALDSGCGWQCEFHAISPLNRIQIRWVDRSCLDADQYIAWLRSIGNQRPRLQLQNLCRFPYGSENQLLRVRDGSTVMHPINLPQFLRLPSVNNGCGVFAGILRRMSHSPEIEKSGFTWFLVFGFIAGLDLRVFATPGGCGAALYSALGLVRLL